MPKFHVTRREIHDQLIEIEGDDITTKEEAIKRVADGEGDYLYELEFNRTMATDTWDAEEIKP